MKTPLCTAALALAGLFLACGGGGGGGAAPGPSSLSYANPTGGDYRLVADPASTGSRLVLDLVGPGGRSLYGVGFYLSVDDSKAAWSPSSGGWATGPAFTNPLIKGKVQGGVPQAGIYQLGSTAPPAIPAASQTLATVALELTASGPPPGTVIPLQAGSALVLTSPGGSPATQPIAIAVGTLRVQ